MRTTIVLVIDHKKPIPNLDKLVEQRSYTIDGVSDANVQSDEQDRVDPITAYYTDRNNSGLAAKAP